MPPICAGSLNKRIILQSNTPAQDAYGAPIESWTTLATVWAEKVPQSKYANEKFKSDLTIGTLTVSWRIRYRTDVDNRCRLTHGGNIYNILGVEEEGVKDSLLLITEAIIGR